MKIMIEIPKEFERDFSEDRFKETLTRILWDCRSWKLDGITGSYEHETIEMLMDSFEDAVVMNERN